MLANHIFSTRFQIDLLDYMLACNEAIREGCGLPLPPSESWRKGADSGITVDAIWSQLYGQMYRISDYAHYARINSNDEDIANQAQRCLDLIHASAEPTMQRMPSLIPRLVQIGMDTRTWCKILVRQADKPIPDPSAPRQFFRDLLPIGAKWENVLVDVQFVSKPPPRENIRNGYCTVHDRADEIRDRMEDILSTLDNVTMRQVKPFDFDGLNFQLIWAPRQ